MLIDRRGHLAQLVVQSVLAAAAYVFRSSVPLAVAALLFGVSALLWPRGALVLRAHRALAGRRGVAPLDDGRPARVSTAIAAVNFAGAAGVVIAGADTSLLWPALLMLAGALMAEAALGACLPCELIVWASRRGLLKLRRPIGSL